MKILKKIYRVTFLPNYHAVWVLSLSQKLRRFKFFNQIVRNYLVSKYGIHFGRNSIVGSNLKLPHPLSIVIGEGTEIGNDCTIYHNVTFGTRHSKKQKKFSYPKIGNSTTIYTNVVVLGEVIIGDNCIVGANSLVLSDIPDNSIYVNGKIKNRGINNEM